MRAYGLPRNHDVGSPDCGDMHFYALKASSGRLPGKNGRDMHSMKTSVKRRTRTFWKKKERSKVKVEIMKEVLIERRK